MSGSEVVRKFYEKYFADRARERTELKRARETFEESRSLTTQIGDANLTPAATATNQETQKRFNAAVEKLDETDQEIIVMRHFEQLTNREVARVLELSETAASMLYLRAMRKLKEIISREEEQ